MAQELTARKQLAQSAADKLQAGTLTGPTAFTNTAQIKELLVELRLARSAIETLLAETKEMARGTAGTQEPLAQATAARIAALRQGINNAEANEFEFKRWSSEEQRPRTDQSGWVARQVLLSFLRGRKAVINNFFGSENDSWDNESEAASFVHKLAAQINDLIGEKPVWHRKKVPAKNDEGTNFELTLKLRK
jgi:hypothetical protein